MEYKGCTESELLDLERQYWKAIQLRDINAALRLTDDPCLLAGASGVAKLDSAAFRKMMDGSAHTLHAFQIANEAQVRMLTEDVAILAYKIREKLTVEGKPLVLEVADSSTWVRRRDGWKCAMHTESIHGDAFGRDRIKPTVLSASTSTA